MNKLYNEIGQRINVLRLENGLTQAQLAEALDISTKHMSEVERGLSSLSIEKFVQLCDILSTDLDYLIRGLDRRSGQESAVPTYILNLFNSDDEATKQLLKEYMLLFRKLREY